ncbi:hypothetical protein FRC06_000222 [Ceratobasidium sp. 370]|nr:hypothetical protein FRC06_000222 [Ceratobasidium sp. 370]
MSVSRTAFHFAPISHGPITAQWSASSPQHLSVAKKHKHSHSEPREMYGTQHQPQHYPFPAQPSSSRGHGHGLGHSRTGATHDMDDEEELERQLDYETDANTEYNAVKLSADIRPRELPPVESRHRDKGKERHKDRSKDKERGRRSKAQRQHMADQARRTRRRAEGLDSDTTQGDDTDDGEYVTGHGSSRRHVSAGGRGFKPTPTQQPAPASSSMPNIPPTPAHPYISKVYTSPAGQYGYPQQPGYSAQHGYGYAQQPAGYGASQQSGGYAQQYGGPSYQGTPAAGGYFSPSAPASANFPNLFASTDPRNNPNDSTRQEAEAAARRKLRENPLPGLPGQGGLGGMSRLGAGGMPALAGGVPGAGGIPGLGGTGVPSLDGRGRIPGLDGRGGMPALAGGGMPGLAGGGVPGAGGLGTLPGGYGGQSATREKSKSKHTKAASTGTLPGQSHAQVGYSQYAPPARAPKTSDPPSVPSKSYKGRLSRERDRGRSGERDRDKDASRSRSRQRPGWDTAESLLAQPQGPDGLRGVRDGPAILHGAHYSGPTMINGVPVVNAGPSLERVPSRSKWGKITGLFTRGRRGSAASQNAPEPAPHVPPPPAPLPTTRHKSGLRNLSFDRFRRGPGHHPPPEPPVNVPPPLRGHQGRPDVGIPPGQVPVGIHVDKYGKIVDPPEEFFGMPPIIPSMGGGIPPPLKSPAGLARQSSWDARSQGMGASLVSPHTPRGIPSPHMHMPSPHMPKGTPRYASESILSPRPSEVATPYTQTARYEAAGATPYMREREPSIATTIPRTLPRPRTADSTMFGGTTQEPPSPIETPSPDVTEADVARAAQHRDAFEWAEQEARERMERGDEDAPYIFNGFPTWVNWDLFTRLENQERRSEGLEPLPRVTSLTKPEKLQDIYDEWHATRDKWVDRFWDPSWARFMHETGGPIQRELAEERQTSMGRALEAARVYQRENSELPLAKREFVRGYLWDEGYMHTDWQWIKLKPWKWTVEHENDERRANGRAPLPRYNPGMSKDDWRDVRDVWHTTASKWAEKRKDLEWVERDRREGITPERRMQLEQQFLRSRQQHKVIRKASGQRSREALRSEERDKIRHDSAMELLARRQEVYKQTQVGGTPKISEVELARRRQAQQELEELMRTPATVHPRPASSVGHGSMRRGEGSVRLGGSSVGHRPLDDDISQYDSTSSEDVPPTNPYLRAPGGPPLPRPADPLPDWMRRQKTSDPPSSSLQSGPGRNPSVPSVNKPKKPGILKGILKRTLSMQRNNNQNGPGRNNSQRRNDQPSHNSFGGMFGHGHSRSEVSPVDNPWAGVFRSAHPVTVQPIRFDRSHPFSMTSPHALDYEGKLYPSAIHLWHAMRFLRRPAGRGRGRAEESWHPELAEGIRQASEPELYADQWAHAGAIGKDGTIMRSLQRPDWEEVQMNKMDEVLALKFTQHPALGKMLMSTHPAQLLYMWDAPWGAGPDLKGPNNLGKAIMRCRDRLILQSQGR